MSAEYRGYISKIHDLKQDIRDSLTFIGWKNMVKYDDTVFVKPNFTYPFYKEGITTNPIVLKELIASLHSNDITCRPQTVDSWNPGYYTVLKAFEEVTRVGGILNTSFNLHGYPLVGTPEIAMHTLDTSDLDVLAIGNWLGEK